MNLVNTTKLQTGFTVATDKTGRESLVVVAKGTYAIPARPERAPVPADEQVPPVMCDVYGGEPGLSAPLYEIDFAPRKPRCDVLLNGSCHAPGGRPVPRVPVTFQVGTFAKTFHVVGNRVYKAGLLYRMAGEPEPFAVLPVSYDQAYGGVDRPGEDPKTHRWYPLNHAGVGYHPGASAAGLDGKPLPNTEDANNPVTRANGSYRPMAFGVVGRAWQPRAKWAGTYDQKWLDSKSPFLPDDFDERYFQSAPEDQQIDFPAGGEEVALTNLTPQGHTSFRLPDTTLPVVYFLKNGEERESPMVVDTVLVEPDRGRFMLVWRANLPLRRNIFEVTEAAVGKPLGHWVRAREHRRRMVRKRRFASLNELAVWNREHVRLKRLLGKKQG